MNAIVYLRVSSEEQVNGNGLDRQLETATSYCEHNQLKIVQIIKDEGKSASKGHHISEGEFGKLLIAVRTGRYRNHALVIECLDRLSRQGFEATFAILSDLRKNGVELHEAKNNRVIRSLDDLGTGILAMVDSYQAAEYTKKLSERTSKGWRNRRANLRPGQPMTKWCPVWLEVVGEKNNRSFVLKPDVVAVVQEMFDLAAQGVGTHNILKRLNGRMGGRSLSWVAKTLKNRAVLGEYHYKRQGDPVPLYPPIVTQSQYNAARLVIDKKLRNDGLVSGGRYNSERVDNLFSKLVWDVTEGEPRPMCYQRTHRKGKITGEYLRTVPSGDERKPNSISYKRFENDVLSFLEKADWKQIAGQNESEEVKHVAAEVDGLLGEIDRITRHIAKEHTAMEDDTLDVSTIKVLAGRIAKYEADLSIETDRKNERSAKLDAARAKCDALYTPETLLSLVSSHSPESFDMRLRLKAEIAKRVKRIDMQFEGRVPVQATITLISDWRDMILFAK